MSYYYKQLSLIALMGSVLLSTSAFADMDHALKELEKGNTTNVFRNYGDTPLNNVDEEEKGPETPSDNTKEMKKVIEEETGVKVKLSLEDKVKNATSHEVEGLLASTPNAPQTKLDNEAEKMRKGLYLEELQHSALPAG